MQNIGNSSSSLRWIILLCSISANRKKKPITKFQCISTTFIKFTIISENYLFCLSQTRLARAGPRTEPTQYEVVRFDGCFRRADSAPRGTKASTFRTGMHLIRRARCREDTSVPLHTISGNDVVSIDKRRLLVNEIKTELRHMHRYLWLWFVSLSHQQFPNVYSKPISLSTKPDILLMAELCSVINGYPLWLVIWPMKYPDWVHSILCTKTT